MCSRFVPRFLTAEMRQRRKVACEKNLQVFDQIGRKFLDNIVTEDETPLSLYIPYSRRESKEWVLPTEKPAKVMRSGTSHRKCLMLSLFWDSTGVVLIDYTDGNINAEYYSNLISEARRLRRKPRNENLYLLHDNAPVHSHRTSFPAPDLLHSIIHHTVLI